MVSASVRSIILSVTNTVPSAETALQQPMTRVNRMRMNISFDLFSFIMMTTLGWFVLIISFLGFLQVRRWEWNIQRSTMVDMPEDLQALETLDHTIGMRA
ncbi:uncharacterized protein EI90DRAFT_378520 [Cantharellus anzutake]|uniref:uncharacterized protein n=1 Tax=Cantharellus anzutake TaxID=1750568 RepID=UPI0019055C09|nr:uncharacterized protein EI90DRAFT_423469 [Cantharellus anzutake]XP_038918366.1 uncharacterized protein EI90DRAFT_378520 [Cantharellus anzutake]KAF8314640.1 hypothetical protein EI90DRAFT_423469 [Cantharellus anzutake]KAF8334938.1 hypothetical protein EI90DRAFT_378520 [Cantharellus anzutake]